MKKFLLFVLLCFSFINVFSQLDREHWFAPMVDRVGNSSQYQSIYMSTNETTPFQVQIYHNNVVVSTVTISKNNPVKYSIPNNQRNRIITTSQSDMFKPVAMGFYLKGQKPFFASLRFSILNHGEIQTSKGTAGLGREFRAVMAPITANVSYLNFMNSIMATEDNTHVTITGFQPNVRFSDNVTRTQITFTLNKGQSYIIDGSGSYSQNYTGYIGAKIVSDKPVIIANGNFNGQYAGNYTNSSDILMDQGVPIDKLGQEFILMKGNGSVTSNMEKALILATEDNTDIYLNGATTPSATINAGAYYVTNNTAYIAQGSGHYNMHIKSTKNVYVYQLLAGANAATGGTEEATGGMNYIPPLSCYLPKKIDEIGKIDENEYASNTVSYTLTVPTKLNIITERGATVDVKRNGTSLTLNSSNGPFNVTGNNNWVTYSIPNISGNIAVFSTNAVTAGISAGDNSVGYGGYFAGFSYLPLIVKTGKDCLNEGDVFLELTPGFDYYQWYERDLAGNETLIPGANSNIYQVTHAGIYFAKLKQGSCDPVTTQDYKFYNCDSYTNYDYNSCGSEVITPHFTLSTQTVDPATVQITVPPTKGTAVINPATGIITYTAFPTASGTDKFKFSFKGIGAIPDTEEVQITVEMIEWNSNAKLEECSINGIATYNLTLADVSPDTTLQKSYFKTQNGALNNITADKITNFTAYTTTDTTVYARLVNSINCVAVAPIILKSKLAPDVKENLYTQSHCDEDIDGKIDGIYKVNVSTITPIVLLNFTSFTVRYYDTEEKANAGGTNNITGTYSFAAGASIWIRVDSPDGCPFVVKEILLNIGPKVPLITSTASQDVCDIGANGSETINLSDYIPLFTATAGATATYYNTLANAQNNTGAIPASQVISANKTFYYRIKAAGFCDEIGTLNISFTQGTPSTTLLPEYIVCEGDTVTLDAGSGFTHYQWSNNAGSATTQTVTVGAGTYWVDLTNSLGCIYHQTVTVTDSPKPQLNTSAYNGIVCDNDFDGIIHVKFSTQVTPLILPNAASYTITYYGNAAMTDVLPNDWSYNAPTTVYVQVTSPYCPPVNGTINFGFANRVPLISSVVTSTVCDNNLDGTENVKLANYLGMFTTASGASAKYFNTLADAQNNTGAIPSSQDITGDRTFYYRIKASGYCDEIGTLNLEFHTSTPSTTLQSNYIVCEGDTTTLDAGSGFTHYQWSSNAGNATSQTVTVGAGTYYVDLTNSFGCVYRQTVTVTDSPKPQLNTSAYNGIVCDNDFDGIIHVKFSTQVTPLILPNAASYTITYYGNAAMTDVLPNDWSYNAPTTVYVQVTSPYCPPVNGTINFGFANRVPLISSVVTSTVCDNNLDGTENVKLANYLGMFTTASGASAKYFNTLADAQNNTGGIPSSQDITADRTFYYRIKATGYCDEIGTLNLEFHTSTPSTTLLPEYTICATDTVTLDPGSGYISYKWSNNAGNATTQTVNVGPGTYWVDLTNSFGCVYRQTVKVTGYPVAKPNFNAYKGILCDEDFDGKIHIKFSTDVTPVILPNASLYTTFYYSNPGMTQALPDDWYYTADTTVYVEIVSPYCPPITGTLNFAFGNRIPLLSYDESVEVCDDDLDGIKSVNLANYKNLFINDNSVQVTYFDSLSNAEQNIGSLSNPMDISGTKVYYLRFSKTGFCSEIAKLTVTVKIPKTSDTLEDKNICPGTTTELDAGPGFDKYKWSTGATTQSINVGAGDYWVDLTYDGCTYRQYVSVKEVEIPEIVSIEISGTTVTINVSGGNPPYQYSVDGINYQDSNVFYNVPYGQNTAYVTSAEGCLVMADFTVIRLLNVITPNGDGYNDYLDYSGLASKESVLLKIFDRNGLLIFTGDKSNNYTWDGKIKGRPVNTGSYWYVLQWRDPNTETLRQSTGWVMVKNRE